PRRRHAAGGRRRHRAGARTGAARRLTGGGLVPCGSGHGRDCGSGQSRPWPLPQAPAHVRAANLQGWPGMTAAVVAVVAIAVAAIAFAAFLLWRDPYALVRAEFARERLALGLARREVEVDGIRWVYAEGVAAAAAPVLVLLHGYTGSKENWYPVARRLRGRRRLLIPDLPGWGESQRSGVAGHGFAAQAARVAAFIRATCDGPVTVLGHSMGGGIAAVLA